MLDWFARNVNDVEQGQDWRLDGAQHIEKLPFIERLIRAGRRHVYWKIGQNKSVNLVALQRMYLHCLQEKLLIDAARILNSVGEKEKSVESEDMRKLIDGVGKQLHTYCEAVRDRDYMRQCSKSDSKIYANPFMLSSDKLLERLLMEESGLPAVASDVLTPRQNKLMAELPGRPWDHFTNVDEAWKRFWAAIFGTTSLVLPMAIMIFWATSRGARVGTVIAFTLAFAFAVGWRWQPSPLELFQATAAYTAILVVFVGTAS